MKQLLLILISLSLSSYAFADPAGENRAQGAIAIAGMAGSIGISVEKFNQCSKKNVVACIVGAAAVVAAGGQGYSATQSFINAKNMDGGRNPSMSTGPATGDTTFGGDEMPDMPTMPEGPSRDDQIVNAIEAKLKSAEEMADGIRAKGIDIDGMLKNPGEYLSDEQMAELQASTGSLNKEITDEEVEQAVDDLLEESGDMGYGVASSIGNQGGVFVPSSKSKFKLDKFLNFRKAGLRNSAPGYYGNVRLRTLKPKSKKTLFERVSIATKRLM